MADFNGGMRKSLFHKDLGEPRAIAIYPIEGWMFWTDWGATPKIERAGMDGSYREVCIFHLFLLIKATFWDRDICSLYTGPIIQLMPILRPRICLLVKVLLI